MPEPDVEDGRDNGGETEAVLHGEGRREIDGRVVIVLLLVKLQVCQDVRDIVRLLESVIAVDW
jgi:hypothetical protein